MLRNMLVVFVLVCLLQPGTILAQQGGIAPTTGDAELSGKLYGADGKTPLPDATVIAFHLSTEEVFRSQPTGTKGEYLIENLPYGYFDLAIETANGVFVGNQVINLPPSGKASVIFSVTEFAEPPAPGDPRGRDFPGSSAQSMGIAAVSEKLRGRDFWRSPKGIAILGGGGALVLLALAGGGGSSGGSSSSSSSTP